MRPRLIAGFTLIELIVGIVVMAIALVVISSLIVPQARRSIEPVYQFRAAELGSSLMNEILSKSFDEQSDHTGGGLWRCSELRPNGQATSCTPASDYGPDAATELRQNYNDVDDYDSAGQFINITDSMGADLSQVYRNFRYRVAIDSAEYGINSAKRIDLWIRDPAGAEYVFSAYRWNY